MRVDRPVLTVEGDLASLLSECCSGRERCISARMRKKVFFQTAYLGLINEHTYWMVITPYSVMTFTIMGRCDFCMKYLLLALTNSSLTKVALISGCLVIVIQILQTFYEINVI